MRNEIEFFVHLLECSPAFDGLDERSGSGRRCLLRWLTALAGAMVKIMVRSNNSRSSRSSDVGQA